MALEFLNSFVEQSQRVISITYKPKEAEYRQMAFTTAIGMALVGIIGFVISLAASFLR
ncbi:MAG TPA: protein translocase SEC61 complex subunit gamma [Candidatus Norongarragalinales archaeon]|nr:protein translocase SEC61 complex subunit gamma [Candidatus Norongarragalinales archaeon]